MPVDVRVPSMGESVTSATVAAWLKQPGDAVRIDEPLVSLDSDKATMELPAPAAGTLVEVLVAAGDTVTVGQVVARIGEGAAAKVPAPTAAASAASATKTGPAVRKAMRDAGVEASEVKASGEHGRVTRADVDAAAARREAPTPSPAPVPTTLQPMLGDEPEEIVAMSSIRKRIAERLLEAKNSTAMLTTFNEIDMSAVLALRERYQDRFVKKYGCKLGFMSFFAKASIEALKAFPAANAEIRGDEIHYKHFYHLGVAVSGPRGLVVPVVKHADRLSFAETEKAIAAFGEKARGNTISVDDMKGGTFTITNGGIFGSMMSTPILNTPQVAILGMHAIQKRAVVVDDQIVIRPMMYVALSYDHRLLDGREAVSFLVRVKECIEDPERVLLEV